MPTPQGTAALGPFCHACPHPGNLRHGPRNPCVCVQVGLWSVVHCYHAIDRTHDRKGRKAHLIHVMRRHPSARQGSSQSHWPEELRPRVARSGRATKCSMLAPPHRTHTYENTGRQCTNAGRKAHRGSIIMTEWMMALCVVLTRSTKLEAEHVIPHKGSNNVAHKCVASSMPKQTTLPCSTTVSGTAAGN